MANESNGHLPGQQLLYTIDQAASALQLGRTSLKQLVQRGDLVSVKIGRSRRVPLSALTSYVERLQAEADTS